jgi:SpoVK/Ycf46/Vps4 family AAA+-type ATPase
VTTGGLLYFQGASGVGKRTTAEALCRRASIELLTVDAELLVALDLPSFELFVGLAGREALLQKSALYWEGFEVLLAEDKRPLLNILLRELEKLAVVSFLGGDTTWEPSDRGSGLRFLRIEFSRPDSAQRAQLWEAAVRCAPRAADFDLSALANAFRLTAGQIHSAALTAKSLARWRDPEGGQVNVTDLYEGCRLHSSRKLATLGRKIKPHHTWSDIVLPEDRLRQLQEICNSMKYRSVVYDQWGFDRKLSLGKGLNVLFAGPSGTGKTMAAGIMAGELGLDLYKIDLSTVVSKYIGETEKNLARIFAEAESSNAILFFDEADALFGKRSEVRDSHDRYANIEINYLLQKMEEHEGVAILATNFRKNMDDAFVRRMHFTVEFPFPDEADRRRIWERIWPAETPQSAEVDLDFMARRFEIAGGNIRNIALAAAVLAASDGGVVNMAHLLHGTKREYQKMGKVVMQGEFA